MKIVLLPLDERPCNYDFPFKLFSKEGFDVVRPCLSALGDKKNPSNEKAVVEFLENECKNADGLVLSLDMLLYGGLLPSRLHFYEKEQVEKRLSLIKKLKEKNEKLKIYAFGVIMRCPKYSSNDEEPDYYGVCGEQIHKIGVLKHKMQIGIIDEQTAQKEIDNLKEIALDEYLLDYEKRRKFNLEFNLDILDLVSQKIIDFLIIPQDDAAVYGYTAIEQAIVRKEISKKGLQFDVLMYPGADEIALTLLARLKNVLMKKSPKVFVKYASSMASCVVPSYEDRSLSETLKYHIIASGCRLTDSSIDADLIFATNVASGEMKEANYQNIPTREYQVERTLVEFVLAIEEMIKQNKAVILCDNAYANGGELELISMLVQRKLLKHLAGYAAWNTSSNTVGTCLAQGINYFYEGRTTNHLNFLAERFVEDVGYCSVVRKKVANNLDKYGYNYFYIKEKQGEISKLVEHELKLFTTEFLGDFGKLINIKNVYMPWRRMFEVGIDAVYEGDNS